MVVVVVGGLAAGQLGLLVTSSSLAWPGLAAWTLTDPSRDNFHQKSSAADHLTTAREQRGISSDHSCLQEGFYSCPFSFSQAF